MPIPCAPTEILRATAAAALWCSVALSAGCTTPERGPTPSPSGSVPAARTEDGSAAAGAAEGSAPGGAEGAGETAASPPSEAIRKLLSDIQPDGDTEAAAPEARSPRAAPPRETPSPAPAPSRSLPEEATAPADGAPPEPDGPTLEAAFAEMVRGFVAALESGDAAAAGAFLFADEHYQRVLTPGIYSIAGPSWPAQNTRALHAILEAAGRRPLTYRLAPGQLGTTGTRSGTYRTELPNLTRARLTLQPEGAAAPLVVDLHQSIWLDGAWKIFQLKIP